MLHDACFDLGSGPLSVPKINRVTLSQQDPELPQLIRPQPGFSGNELSRKIARLAAHKTAGQGFRDDGVNAGIDLHRSPFGNKLRQKLGHLRRGAKRVPLDDDRKPFRLGCSNNLFHHLEQAEIGKLADGIADQLQGNEDEVVRQVVAIGHGSLPIFRQIAADGTPFLIFEKRFRLVPIDIRSAQLLQRNIRKLRPARIAAAIETEEGRPVGFLEMKPECSTRYRVVGKAGTGRSTKPWVLTRLRTE